MLPVQDVVHQKAGLAGLDIVLAHKLIDYRLQVHEFFALDQELLCQASGFRSASSGPRSRLVSEEVELDPFTIISSVFLVLLSHHLDQLLPSVL
jgi:hypothetical protein